MHREKFQQYISVVLLWEEPEHEPGKRPRPEHFLHSVAIILYVDGSSKNATICTIYTSQIISIKDCILIGQT